MCSSDLVTPELTRQREAELNPSPKDKSDNVTSNRKKTDESISNPPKETTPGLTDRKLDEETEAQRKKVRRTMREYKKGKLHSGSKKGKKVTSREQAIAIALNQAGLSKNQVNESAQAILEEIQNNLQEQFVYIYENYDESVMEQFLASLTMEEAYLLGLNEEEPEGQKYIPRRTGPVPAEGAGGEFHSERPAAPKPVPVSGAGGEFHSEPSKPAAPVPAPAATPPPEAPTNFVQRLLGIKGSGINRDAPREISGPASTPPASTPHPPPEAPTNFVQRLMGQPGSGIDRTAPREQSALNGPNKNINSDGNPGGPGSHGPGPAPAPKPAARPAAPAQPAPAPAASRPRIQAPGSRGSSGGSFSGHPEWARRAFNPAGGG